MDLDKFLFSMLGEAASGRKTFQVGIAPVHVGEVSLFRFDNLTINIPTLVNTDVQTSVDITSMDPPAVQDVEGMEPKAHDGNPSSSEFAQNDKPQLPDVADEPSDSDHHAYTGLAGPCRLEPLLVFDLLPSDNRPAEFEIAPRIRLAVVPTMEADVELTQFGTRNRRRLVRFEDGIPVGVRCEPEGTMVAFDRKRLAAIRANERWSFHKLDPSEPIRLAAGGKVRGSVSIVVDERIWAASWLLMRRDPRGRIRDSSFPVLLRQDKQQ